jgi:hypothetical protein
MRIFRYFLLGSFVVCLMLVGGLRGVLGRQAQPPIAELFLPDDTCEEPSCWYGINTNEMSHAESTARIMALPEAQQASMLEWNFSYGGRTGQFVRLDGGRNIELRPHGLRLGDVILALGWTEYAGLGTAYEGLWNGDYMRLVYPNYPLTVTLIFRDSERLTPNTPVWELVYWASAYPADMLPTPQRRPRFTELDIIGAEYSFRTLYLD